MGNIAKIGRPKKIINQKQFEATCSLQCSKEEICLILGVTDKTLDNWVKEIYKTSFSEVFSQKRELGKMSLRRNQWKQAEHNHIMAIFLGKQYLGQKDKTGKEEDETDVLIKKQQLEKLKAETEMLINKNKLLKDVDIISSSKINEILKAVEGIE